MRRFHSIVLPLAFLVAPTMVRAAPNQDVIVWIEAAKHAQVSGNDQTLKGAGTIVRRGGTFVVAPLHLLKRAERCNATVHLKIGGALTKKEAELVYAAPNADLAFLTLKNAPADLPAVEMRDAGSDEIYLGRWTPPQGGSVSQDAVAVQRASSSDAFELFTIKDGIRRTNKVAPFRNTYGEFRMAMIDAPEKDIKSGTGIFRADGTLAGMIIHRVHNGPALAVQLSPVALGIPESLPITPCQPPPPEPDVEKEVLDSMTARATRNVWPSVLPESSCNAVWPLIGALDALDGASLAEASDNSDAGPLILGPGYASLADDAEQQLLAASKVFVEDSTCGPWRHGVGTLVETFIRIKAQERRFGTLRTLWKGIRTSLIKGHTDKPQLWLHCGPVYLNPIETLLALEFGASLLAPIGQPNGVRIFNALQSCAERKTSDGSTGAPGDNVVTAPHSLVRPESMDALTLCQKPWIDLTCGSGLAMDDKLDAPAFQEKLDRIFAELDTSRPWVYLASNAPTQAKFWRLLINAGILNHFNLLAYATNTRLDVLEQRQALLAKAPSYEPFAPRMNELAPRVANPQATMATASTRALLVDQTLDAVPPKLRSGKSISDLFQALVDDETVLVRALKSRRNTDPLEIALNRATIELDAFDVLVATALVEMLDGTAGLAPAGLPTNNPPH